MIYSLRYSRSIISLLNLSTTYTWCPRYFQLTKGGQSSCRVYPKSKEEQEIPLLITRQVRLLAIGESTYTSAINCKSSPWEISASLDCWQVSQETSRVSFFFSVTTCLHMPLQLNFRPLIWRNTIPQALERRLLCTDFFVTIHRFL